MLTTTNRQAMEGRAKTGQAGVIFNECLCINRIHCPRACFLKDKPHGAGWEMGTERWVIPAK